MGALPGSERWLLPSASSDGKAWFGPRLTPAESGREVIDAPVALLERFVAIALQHQGGGKPEIDLGYHGAKTAHLRSTKI